MKAIRSGDLSSIDRVLEEHSSLLDALREAEFHWHGVPPLAVAPDVDTTRHLLDLGARWEPVSRWWNPGFGVIKKISPEVGRFLVAQGAEVSPHAAAGMGLTDTLTSMIEKDPQVVHAPGGDATTPLHFARNVETATLLSIRARSSTPGTRTMRRLPSSGSSATPPRSHAFFSIAAHPRTSSPPPLSATALCASN